jgi:ribosomal protein S18 acetylase RimI-like enzyme
MLIRDARREEFPDIGELRVAAYLADGFLSPNSGYTPHLRALGADGVGQVLVAVADEEIPGDGRPGSVIGTVMLQPWPDGGEIVTGPDEAEIRALAVSPEARSAGVGRALVAAVIELAAREGVRHLVLCTQPQMKHAHHLYEDAGFVRLPERDWQPESGISLLVYGKRLDGSA